uniref:Uncharacterized protein n=1 Tax=Candidatus Methanogaster sp. ANME-2c ERB4 TaxID=2759911 RepID=A0A7G9YGE5_9EURY|nr:hypothetical protein ONOHIMFI_00005 [Methanosarcinales archaeon ANME-2c ERB4]
MRNASIRATSEPGDLAIRTHLSDPAHAYLMGNPERQRQSPIPELVVGVRNFAAASVCKDHADAVYFSLDRFSLRARALREHVGAFDRRAALRNGKETSTYGRIMTVLATWARAKDFRQTPDDEGEAERLNTCQKTK